MNKAVSVSVFIFWVAVIMIVGLGVLSPNKGLGQNNATVSLPSGNIVLTASEVKRHNSAGDCWIIVSNKVYNVSSVINSHPGGAGTILPYCGKDATQAFQTKNRGVPHSQQAYQWLDQLLLGNVNARINGSAVQQSQQNQMPNNIEEDD